MAPKKTFKDGILYVAHERILLRLILVACMVSALNSGLMSSVPILATSKKHLALSAGHSSLITFVFSAYGIFFNLFLFKVRAS